MSELEELIAKKDRTPLEDLKLFVCIQFLIAWTRLQAEKFLKEQNQ